MGCETKFVAETEQKAFNRLRRSYGQPKDVISSKTATEADKVIARQALMNKATYEDVVNGYVYRLVRFCRRSLQKD